MYSQFIIFENVLGMCLIFLPAKAGWTGLEPLRFFTGTVGTLREREREREKKRSSIRPMDTLIAVLLNVLQICDHGPQNQS